MERKSKSSGSKDSPVDWSAAEDHKMILVLTEEKAAGNQAQTRWKPIVWQKIVEAISTFPSSPSKKANHCKTRWQRLKADFWIVKELCEQSGFGWDDVRQIVTASKEVWDAYLVTHPRAKPFRKKPFPLYNKIEVLVSAVLANGSGAMHLGETDESLGTVDENVGSYGDWAEPELLGTPITNTPSSADNESSGGEGSDLEIISAPVLTKKRHGLSTPSTRSSSLAPPTKCMCKSHVDSLKDVSTVLHSIANAYNERTNSNSSFPRTPERRMCALQTVEKEEGLSDTEIVDVARLFIDKDKADMYLSFSNLVSRGIWLNKELSKYQKL